MGYRITEASGVNTFDNDRAAFVYLHSRGVFDRVKVDRNNPVKRHSFVEPWLVRNRAGDTFTIELIEEVK